MNTQSYAQHKTGFAALAGAAVFVCACMLVAALAVAPSTAFADGRDVGPRVGASFKSGGNTYKVLDRAESDGDAGEVKLVKYASSKTSPTINSVKYKGYKYEVEVIGKNAFNNAKGHKITSVKLGKNVDRIEARAFYGCKKLKSIDIAKSDVVDVDYEYGIGFYLDEINIGSQAFKNTAKNVTVKCGSNKAEYKKIVKNALVKKGLSSKAKVVK